MLSEKSRLISCEYLDGIVKSSVDDDISREINSVPTGYAGSEIQPTSTSAMCSAFWK